MTPAGNQPRQSVLAGFFLAMIVVGAPSPGQTADPARVQRIAAELNIPRRAWTICTVNEVGRAIQGGDGADAVALADRALATCADEEQALRTKADELLGTEPAERLMGRLKAEARDALIGSARTLAAARSSGDKADPAWPRVLAPAR